MENTVENTLQRWMAESLASSLKRYLAEVYRGALAQSPRHAALRTQGPFFVSGDHFWFYRKGDPNTHVAPDVYAISGVDPERAPRTWKLWELRNLPLFALEIVSDDVARDYDDAPAAYRHTGVQELVVFDPEAPSTDDNTSERARVRWQIWRRESNGQWGGPIVSDEDRVESAALGCWLRLVGKNDTRRICIALGTDGEALYGS
jgi:hypothetical protein